MKKYFLSLLFITSLLIFLPRPAKAYYNNICKYSSTQSRVQQNIKHPWVQNLEIPLRASLNGWTRFRVGSFHNQTGQFAYDTRIHVYGPGINTLASNGQTMWVRYEGTYRVIVTTVNQYGWPCTDTSYVNVRRPEGL